METNIELYLEYIPIDDLNISQEDIDKEDIIKKNRIDYLKKYIEQAKKPGTFAGDLEISTPSILFGSNIRDYTQGNTCYNLYYEFNKKNENNEFLVQDIINLLFINNNHFQLLLKIGFKKNALINNIINNVNLKELLESSKNKKRFKYW